MLALANEKGLLDFAMFRGGSEFKDQGLIDKEAEGRGAKGRGTEGSSYQEIKRPRLKYIDHQRHINVNVKDKKKIVRLQKLSNQVANKVTLLV